MNTDNTNVDKTLFSAISVLESHITNLDGMAHALSTITEGYDEEHRGAIWLSGKLNTIAHNLMEDWNVAFELAVQADKQTKGASK